jgi:hypothetical protein
MGWTNGVVGPDDEQCEDDDCCCWCCECYDDYLMRNCVGPGDLYPHYAYCPAYHGYYYFRPYNYVHVLYDAASVTTMGGDPRAPYAKEFLRPIFGQSTYVAPILPPQAYGESLPLLEDLLEQRSEADDAEKTDPNYDGDMLPLPANFELPVQSET